MGDLSFKFKRWCGMTADVAMFEISAAALIKNDKNEAQVYGILCGVEFEKSCCQHHCSKFVVRVWECGGCVGGWVYVQPTP